MACEGVNDLSQIRSNRTAAVQVSGRRAQVPSPSPEPVPEDVRTSWPLRRRSERDRHVRLSIIMAAFNEERTIAKAVEEVLSTSYPCDIELIVIDDGSTDRTSEILAAVTDPRLTIFRHIENKGKGAALLSAAQQATGTHLIPFDADMEYAPEDIARMLEPVLKGRCEVVYGTRLFGYNTVYRSYWFAIANRLLTRLANIMYDAYLSDLHTCLKLLPTEMLRSMDVRETGFGLDTEITALILRAGVRPFEVPVSYFGRSRLEGKKINWRDALTCIWILMRVRIRRMPTERTILDATVPRPVGSHLDRQTGNDYLLLLDESSSDSDYIRLMAD